MDLDDVLAEDMDWQGAAQGPKPVPEGKGLDLDQQLADKMDWEGAAQVQGPVLNPNTQRPRSPGLQHG